jgi:hypothetical protein
MYDSNFFIALCSRRSGKSTLFAPEFLDYCLNICKKGDQTLILGNNENNIKNLIIDNALLEPFGGKEYINSINQVYLSTSLDIVKKSMDIKVRFWETSLGQDEYQNWIKEGYITQDLEYVKLLIQPLDNKTAGGKDQARYEGELFNGVKIKIAGGNNPNIGSILSGQAFRIAWLEEIGQLDKNIFGIFIPTVLDRKDEFGIPNGKVIVNGTPPRDETNTWFYKDYVEPYLVGKGVEYENRLGIDIYTDKRYIEGIDSYEGKSVSFTTVTSLCIGDFENIFPYIYGGLTTFNSVQSQRHIPFLGEAFYEQKIPKKAITKVDNNNKHIVFEDYYWDKELDLNTLKYKFNKKYFNKYDYDIVEQDYILAREGSGGAIDFDQYSKEYRMQFNSLETKMFTNFNQECIIRKDEFNPYLYHSIAGYDFGKGQDVEFDVEKHIKESGTCYAKVALIPYGNTYQYIVWETGFISVPSERSIADSWIKLWNEGCPVVADDTFFHAKVISNIVPYQIINHKCPDLSQHRLFGYNKSIYPCYKRKKGGVDKAKLFNDMIGNSRVNNSDEQFIIPNTDKKGRQIMFTDNCTHAINYFTNQKINRKTSQLEKTRDDIYDAITYAIDFIEINVNSDNLNEFWEEFNYWKNKSNQRYDYEDNYNQDYEIDLDMFRFN